MHVNSEPLTGNTAQQEKEQLVAETREDEGGSPFRSFLEYCGKSTGPKDPQAAY